jgi:hypothetical protein
MPERAISCFSAVLLVFIPATCSGAHKATAGPFAGHWWGHTRGLDITRDGRGREVVDDGCCYRVVTLRFRVLNASGTPTKAVATIKVTFARVDEKVFADLHRRVPRVGQIGTLRLRHGVVTDELTKVTFCARDVDKCGL